MDLHERDPNVCADRRRDLVVVAVREEEVNDHGVATVMFRGIMDTSRSICSAVVPRYHPCARHEDQSPHARSYRVRLPILGGIILNLNRPPPIHRRVDALTGALCTTYWTYYHDELQIVPHINSIPLSWRASFVLRSSSGLSCCSVFWVYN